MLRAKYYARYTCRSLCGEYELAIYDYQCRPKASKSEISSNKFQINGYKVVLSILIKE